MSPIINLLLFKYVYISNETQILIILISFIIKISFQALINNACVKKVHVI